MAGLYIHIPFCAQKCAYCDFYSRRASAGTVVGMLDALRREMTHRRHFLAPGSLSTIYVGGGTPSLLSPEQLQGLLSHTAELWNVSEPREITPEASREPEHGPHRPEPAGRPQAGADRLREVTLEANPEDLTDDYLARLAETGFNRLSIGIQSFDDDLLRLMNRRHSAERARRAVRAAQAAGFDNISIDLIFGIPGMTPGQWERSLDEATGLGVRHISAYHLTIEPGTAFGAMARRGALKPLPEASSELQFRMLRRKLTGAGFEHYEISNFAVPGFRAVHNSAYWSGEPYLGIGPSAHSFDGDRRREWVAGSIEKYLSDAGMEAVYRGEDLTDGELFNERIMTSLRTARGLDLVAVRQRFGARKAEGLERRAAKFLADGSLTAKEGRLSVPPEKFLLSDYIIGELFEG